MTIFYRINDKHQPGDLRYGHAFSIAAARLGRPRLRVGAMRPGISAVLVPPARAIARRPRHRRAASCRRCAAARRRSSSTWNCSAGTSGTHTPLQLSCAAAQTLGASATPRSSRTSRQPPYCSTLTRAERASIRLLSTSSTSEPSIRPSIASLSGEPCVARLGLSLTSMSHGRSCSSRTRSMP